MPRRPAMPYGSIRSSEAVSAMAADVPAEVGSADAAADVPAEAWTHEGAAEAAAEAGANDDARPAPDARKPPVEPDRNAHAEVDARAPAPDPRSGDPVPAEAGRVHVLVGIDGHAAALRRRVDVLIAVRHPQPAALLREDPLTGS